MTNCLCGSSQYTNMGIKESKNIFQCRICRSIWTDDYEYSIQYYNDEYPQYYRNTHNSDHDYQVAMNRLSLIRPHITQQSLLDIGSATGAFVKCCRDHGYNAWGIDTMKPLDVLEFIMIGDINIYQFSKTFGIVTAFDIVEHMPDQHVILGKIQLIADDYIFLDQPNPETANDIHWKHIKPKEHGFLMSEQFISQHLSQFRLIVKTSQVYGKMSLIYKRKS